jgi:YbgC/YbaW family acyl-CoA thioester hydrolase
VPDPFRTTFRVRLDDVDYARVLYFARYIHLCMVALEDFFRDGLGLPWTQMLDRDRLVMPTVNVRVDYHHPLRFGDEGEIAITVGHLGTRSVRFDYEMRQRPGGRIVAAAQFSSAFADTGTWKTRPIPPAYRAAFERYLVPRPRL